MLSCVPHIGLPDPIRLRTSIPQHCNEHGHGGRDAPRRSAVRADSLPGWAKSCAGRVSRSEVIFRGFERQTLQQDHAAGAQKATTVATQLGVNPPTEPNKNQKAMHANLGKLSGQAFDRKFASEMVKDHKKEIAEYQKAAKKQGDPAGAYASETLPTLQKHLETAQALTKATSAR